MDVRQNHATHGGEVVGCLLPPASHSVSIGIIALEWVEWLPALQFVPIQPSWVWILDKFWERFAKRLFPSVCFINGSVSPLPAVDILLLSKITLGQCSISLNTCPASLILSSSRLRLPIGWVHNFWRIRHADVGGCTDGCWVLHSAHRVDFVVVPPLHSIDEFLPRGNVRRVLCSTVSSGKSVSAPPAGVSSLVDTLFPLGVDPPFFTVPSVFSSSGWCRRRLSLDERLHLFDYSPVLFRKLKSTHRKLLLTCDVCPPRVLGFLLRRFLGGKRGTEGVVDRDKMVALTPSRKRGLVIEDDFVGKRRRRQSSCLDPCLEAKLKTRSGKVYEAYPKPLMKEGIVKKKDDAPVPIELWLYWLDAGLDYSVSLDDWNKNVVILQEKFLLRRWRQNVLRSFVCWMKERVRGKTRRARTTVVNDMVVKGNQERIIYQWKKGGRAKYRREMKQKLKFVKDLEAARDCVRRACVCTWWDWCGGSRPFFWRWPKEDWVSIRDGRKNFVRETLPLNSVPQTPTSSEFVSRVKEKLKVVREKGYITSQQKVKSLTHFFPVAKTWRKEEGKNVVDEVRMVYDATKSGLNEAVFAPWFAMPTVDTLLRSTVAGSYMTDCDVGEMFLNFMLEQSIRSHAGVDLTQAFPEEAAGNEGRLKECWTRMLMGFAPSPYFVTKDMLIVEKLVRGDRWDGDNVFRWVNVVLNLPGLDRYDPSLPWVYKVREDGLIAADAFWYIDDGRPIAGTAWEAWQAARKIGCTLCYLGLQDASRKRTEVSTTPGEWAGTLVETSSDTPSKLVSHKKWMKGKEILARIVEEVAVRGCLNHKQLERDRGFLVYLSRTYRSICPYLKGIHQTLDSWRSGRDKDGWKLERREMMMYLASIDGGFGYMGESEAPEDVHPVTRLTSDLQALECLLMGDEPTRIPCRVRKTGWVAYGIGDASGDGFGAAIHLEDGLHFRYGQWASSISEKSSNYRELRNLVDTLEGLCANGKLKGCELFLFTDNLVAEYAYYKGSSSSRMLFDLVLRMRKMQMAGDLILHVIHISGTRMQACGVDALSRGNTSEGVMSGAKLLSYLPLHLSALDRSKNVLAWVKSWWLEDEKLTLLTPEGWFEKVFSRGNFLWVPPPAAADVVVEQLCRNFHLYSSNLHVVILPRLMTSKWRKQLLKVSDLFVEMPFNDTVWPSSNFEPLILCIVLPFADRSPWKLRSTTFVNKCARNLQTLWKEDFEVGSNSLRELLVSTRSLDTLPGDVVRRMLHSVPRGAVQDRSASG